MRHLLAGTAMLALSSVVLPLAARAAEEGKAGMPQLDPSSFASQLFWLVVTFVVLYLVLSRGVLPRVGATLGQRADRLSADLEEAARLKQETEKAIADYEAALAKARAEAQSTAIAARNAALAEAAQARAKVEGQLAEQTRAAEAAIGAAKTKALADLNQVAADAAAGIVAKLTGTAPAAADVQAAVASARKA